MGSRSRRCGGALAIAGLCGLSFAAIAQTPGGEAPELTSKQAMELETALAQLNFDPGEIDGVIDERTQAAIRQYQDFAALPADAKATPALLAEVLSVARSFAEMRSKRASDSGSDVSSSNPPVTPAKPQEARREPDPPKVTAAKVPDEVPQETPAAPEQAAKPEAPSKTTEPSKKPEVETSKVQKSPPVPRPAPKKPDPARKKVAAGYNIGSVISRLAETGKAGQPESTVRPDAVPPSGSTGNEQVARIPAPAPAPEPSPGKPGNGYTAFQDAYRAAQAGDFELAARRYTDAIESKKLTLEDLGDAHFNRANVLHFLGRYDKSITDYGVTIGAKPNFAGAYYNRGFAYQAKGEEQQAIEDFRRARDLGLQRLGVRAPDRIPPLR